MNTAIKVGDDVAVAKSGRIVHVLHIEETEYETTTIVVTDHGPYDYDDLKELGDGPNS